MRIEQIIILAYLGVALELGMCLFAYYCSRYNKEHPDVCFEEWMDMDRILKLMLGSIFFPIVFLMLIIVLPFKVIMKLYKINK
jgi:hypothetical protein